MTPDPVGLTVVHRSYVAHGQAHYGGGLVDGAYSLGLFGDAATELCIRLDGDEGLLAAYGEVQFRAPIRTGDVVEVRATLVRVGRRSRDIDFRCLVVCRANPALSASAADIVDVPILATTARGTVVVPPSTPGSRSD